MRVTSTVHINAAASEVFPVVSDIPRSAEIVDGITRVEMLPAGDGAPEDVASGDAVGVGSRWRETRTMFGREETEEMMIAEFDAAANKYVVTSEAHGAKYRTEVKVEDTHGGGPDGDGGSTLTMDFEGVPQGWMAKLMGLLTGWMMTGAMKRMIDEDLNSVKQHIEDGKQR